MLLLYYMRKEGTQWRRTSLKLGEEEYNALLYMSKKLDMTPTNYIELHRSNYDVDNMGYKNNFTAYLRNKIVCDLLKEVENDNR